MLFPLNQIHVITISLNDGDFKTPADRIIVIRSFQVSLPDSNPGSLRVPSSRLHPTLRPLTTLNIKNMEVKLYTVIVV